MCVCALLGDIQCVHCMFWFVLFLHFLTEIVHPKNERSVSVALPRVAPNLWLFSGAQRYFEEWWKNQTTSDATDFHHVDKSHTDLNELMMTEWWIFFLFFFLVNYHFKRKALLHLGTLIWSENMNYLTSLSGCWWIKHRECSNPNFQPVIVKKQMC